MTTKEQITKKLKEVIEEFRSKYSYYKSLTEADVETKLIEALFIDILGWDKQDFIKQQQVRRGENQGRADYAFKIGDKTVFYLEVKKVGISLDKEADKQVISYALSRRVPFAISTNFEQMKIFCVEEGDEKKRVFRVFSKPEEYLEKLQDLLLLTKESFKQDLLLKEAIKEERLKKRISIDQPLLEDLMYIRKLISDDLEKRYSEKYNINEKDEIIQRIIDRLIFIRRCEDIGINPDDIKLEELRHLPQNKTYPRLKEIFKVYNSVYNSGLFAIAKDNDCDDIDINGKIIQDLAYLLYESKDKKYIYNFDWIDADVLGQVYEQYLGKILQQTKSGKAKLKEGQAHRKEQGIYYTPTYIVDYIVKNTVGELLKDKKIKAKNIKILDPACGSGSFLIKSFDCLNEYLSKTDEAKQHKIDSQGSYSVKTEILKNNLFGIDLDNKAVEITKLNLLLKAAEKNRKLPEEVDMHIKHGNSLIDDENVAGLDAFKWVGDFQEGSFDVVIGNPPWSAKIASNSNKFIANKYKLPEKNINLCAAFIMAGLNKVKPNGYFAFLLPKVIIKNEAYSNIRKRILRDYALVEIDDFGVFPGVASDAVCIIVKNNKINDFTRIKFFEKNSLKKENRIEQTLFNKTNIFSLESNKDVHLILNKIMSNSKELGNLFKIKRGIELGQKANLVQCQKCRAYNEANVKYYGSSNKICKKCKHKLQIKEDIIQISSLENRGKYSVACVSGTQIKKYFINQNYFIIPNLSGIDYKEEAFNSKKLLIKRIATSVEGTYSGGSLLAFNTVYSIYGNSSEKELKYVLGILNSKLIKFFYEFSYNVGMNLTTQVTIDYLSKIPIKINENKEQEIVDKVNRILFLNEELKKEGDKKTSQIVKLKQEIEKTDKEIDEFVYKIYGITKEEQKIIEESLKKDGTNKKY